MRTQSIAVSVSRVVLGGAALVFANLGLAPAAASAAAAPTIVLDAAEVAAGWEVLFDGTSTAAWRGFRQPGFPASGWTIDADGCLVTAGGGGDLITKRQFTDFELVLEWSSGPAGNSGIMYRVTEASPATYRSGPEYQILDDAGYGVEPGAANAAGALYGIVAPPADKRLEPAGAFNEARIRVMDGLATHWLNGVRVAETELDGPEFAAAVAASKFNEWPEFAASATGHLALQAHGDPIRFRSIRVRDLGRPMPGEIDLLAGERLDQWSAFLNGDATIDDVWTFEEDGSLSCAGQPIGYIRTNAEYRDYVMQLEWRFDPARGAGNSGVLLRKIGEDKVWPTSVEAQLQSGAAGDFWNIGDYPMTADPERTRGRNTRRTATNERPLGAWNHYEIVVDGGDVVLRVNGETLNAATDVARNAGTICLQSEGAFIQFRRVRLAEIDRPAADD